MEVTLFHFVNEDKDTECIILLEPIDEIEFLADMESDGYKIENKCSLENGSITLPLRTILTRN